MACTAKKGMKRKYLEEEEEEDDISRSRQRQRIIDMSMGKLKLTPVRRCDPDPCLRRSVLILNTLKQIEAELQREGVQTYQSAQVARNEITEMSTTQLTLDPLPDFRTFVYPLPVSSPVPMSVDGMSNEGGDFVAQDSSIVDLMPAKPLAACPQQALSQVSTSLYYGATSQSAAIASPVSSSSEFYVPPSPDCALASTSAYYDAPPNSSQSFSACCDSSAAVNSFFELLKMMGDGDSNNNLAAKGPYSNYFVDENTSLESLTLSEADFISQDHQLFTAAPSLVPSPSSPDFSPASLFPSSVNARTYDNTFASTSVFSSSLGPSSPTLRSASSSMEDIAHYLQEASDLASPNLSPRSSQSSVMTNSQCSTYCRNDSTLDDLDSIMQILVGI